MTSCCSAVAGAVLKTLQKEEMVARFGGDEFVAVKPFSDEGEVDALCCAPVALLQR
ncbi:sensory box/GGDEF family protein [Klebsiella pneumoniae]|uniref:Sensory box/GGDEF family protein n=1 Tax=Klebsiella pneumoniae TaxID=573 RepID=A0A4P0Y269_KLEPN|nr:sensory box/GGDEF family protein [Klebsiella pneumoniae]